MTYPTKTERLETWALGLAHHMAELSKDPSTRVGAVILSPERRLISAGYNGLPRGVEDTEDRLTNREIKYKMIRHAEANAISFATAPLEGASLFCTHPCCAQCAGAAIQAGIRYITWARPDDAFLARWADDMRLVREMCSEAGVTIYEV